MSIKRSAQALGVLCAILGLAYLAVLANVYRHASIDQTTSADVFIVLGASQWNGAPSPMLQARLDHAHDLYKAGFSPDFILTGGSGEGDKFSESAAGKKYLVKRGVPQDSIYIEEASRTTAQNLRGATRIMNEHGYQSAILISHDFHMMRAKKMSRDFGLIMYPSPVATVSGVQKFKYSAREVWTYVLYRMFGI